EGGADGQVKYLAVIELVVQEGLQSPVVEVEYPPRLIELLGQRPALVESGEHQVRVFLAVVERAHLDLPEAHAFLVPVGVGFSGNLLDPVPDAHGALLGSRCPRSCRIEGIAVGGESGWRLRQEHSARSTPPSLPALAE